MPTPPAGRLPRLRALAQKPGAEGLYVFGAVVTLAALVLGFLVIAENVRDGEALPLDLAILHAFRRAGDPAVPIGPPWLPRVMRDLTALGGYAVLTLVTLVAVGFCALLRRFRAAALIVAAALGGLALNAALKDLFARSRPDTLLHLTEVSTASFPSGHAMLSATIYLSLAAIIAQLTARHGARLYILGIALLLTGVVGVSRVYLGVHYPTDVLAGWAIGASWAICCWLAMHGLRRKEREQM